MTRGIVITSTGGPDVLRLAEVVVPDPGPGELLVAVEAAGVNFIDVYLRTGLYPVPLPFRPGKEGCGRVIAVGDGVQGWAEGERVAWPAGTGAYAELAIVDPLVAVRVPPEVDPHDACALMLQGLTAHYLAHSTAPIAGGDAVLVHAGAGGVGLLLTQLLVARGARVVTTAGTPEKAELSFGAGATAVFDYDDFDGGVRELTGGAGLAAVFDGVGATTFDRSLELLRPRGTYVAYGNASGPIDPVDPLRLMRAGSVSLTRPTLDHFIATRAELDARATDLFAAHADGTLDVRIGGTYPLADAATAHTDLEARATTGKLLLLP